MIRPRGTPTGGARMAIPALGVALLGGSVYYFSRTPDKSRVEAKREAVENQRSQGLSGAGVAGTAHTGGYELGQPGSGTKPATSSPSDRAVDTDAPIEKLPSGGVGGGVGAGGSNFRALEPTAKKSSDGTGSWFGGSTANSNNNIDNKGSSGSSGGSGGSSSSGSSGRGSNSSGGKDSSNTKSSSGNSGTANAAGQGLQGLFGVGGSSSGAKGENMNQKRFADTKIHSNDADTPTKRTQSSRSGRGNEGTSEKK